MAGYCLDVKRAADAGGRGRQSKATPSTDRQGSSTEARALANGNACMAMPATMTYNGPVRFLHDSNAIEASTSTSATWAADSKWKFRKNFLSTKLSLDFLVDILVALESSDNAVIMGLANSSELICQPRCPAALSTSSPTRLACPKKVSR